MDIVSPEQRSELMSKIREKDTKPKLLVRKRLFAAGWRSGCVTNGFRASLTL